MKKVLALAAVTILTAGPLNAAVIVDGVAGGDADNTSPFETLQAAVEFANSSSEPVVEIQTNTLPAGLYFADTALNHDLTIQGGASFNPVIEGPVHFLPTNQANLVTLKDLSIVTNATDIDTTSPLNVGCNLTAINCVFDSNSTTAKKMAVTCAVPSAGTVSTLTLTSCTLRGYGALEAGRACRDHIITNCLLEGLPYQDSGDPAYAYGITNSRNFQSQLGEPRFDELQGFTVIQEPRTITISNSIVRAGMPIAWPTSKNGAKWNENEHNVFGHFDATNTVFESLRSAEKTGFPSVIGMSTLPDDQDIVCTFTHCTFFAAPYFIDVDGTQVGQKTVNGLLYFPANGHNPDVAFWNCLFDAPSTDYLIFDNTATAENPNAILTGDGNTYHFQAGNQANRAIITTGSPYTAGEIFEATQHEYVSSGTDDRGAPTFVDTTGHIEILDPSIVGHGIVLASPLVTDIDGEPRPMPSSVSFPDIGADEVNEQASASVHDWAIY